MLFLKPYFFVIPTQEESLIKPHLIPRGAKNDISQRCFFG